MSAFYVNSQNPQWIVYNTSNSGLPHNDINCITSGSDGNTWIGTYGGGLAKFNGSDWTVYNTSNSGLPDNELRSIAVDQTGNKWIGTPWNGLAKFDGTNWTLYNITNSGLPHNYVRSISLDQNGNKWIGTDFGGLAVFNENGVFFSVEDEHSLSNNAFNIHGYPNPAGDELFVETDFNRQYKI